MSIQPASTATLSRNWELLKKRIQPVANSTKKRKAEETAPEPSNRGLRRERRHNTQEEKVYKVPTRKAGVSNRYQSSKTKIVSTSNYTENSGGVSASVALWAEDNNISPEDLTKAYGLPTTTTAVPVPDGGAEALVPGMGDVAEIGGGSKTEAGKYIAIDCEMVGVGGDAGGGQERSALARVSIVNFHGHCVLDVFVKPKEKVIDWRTWVSGVKPSDMENALTFEEAQQKVADLMNNRILVGHALKNDLECLLIGHSKRDIRDTSRFPPFRKLSKGRTPGLKKLAKELLGIDIQGGSHSSIEDARACMLLYRRHKGEFERFQDSMFPNKTKGVGRKSKKKKEIEYLI